MQRSKPLLWSHVNEYIYILHVIFKVTMLCTGLDLYVKDRQCGQCLSWLMVMKQQKSTMYHSLHMMLSHLANISIKSHNYSV